jgi:cbb3-type cytochrome oxidase subunit 3
MPPAPATPEPVAFFICGFAVAAVLHIYRPHKGGVMRQFPLWLCLFLIFPVSFAFSQHQKPPGIVTADQQSNQPLEPPMQSHSRKIDVEQVKQEADELKKLADGVPAQIELLAKNQYPKDLNENLKRIEKLAKHLRSEVTP